MADPYGVIPAPVPTTDDLARAKSRTRLEAADRLGYFIPPEIKEFGRKAFNFASAVDPVQGIMRGMSASGRAFDEDLPYDERRQAAIEASLETLAPLGLIGVGTLAKQPAKNILLDVLTPTGAPSSMTDDVVFDPGRRKFLKQSLAAAGTAAVAPDILSDLGTKATKVAAKSIGNIDAAVAKLINTRKNSSALIERGLNIESNLRRQTRTPKPPKDNKLLLSKDYADKLTLEDEFKKELASSGNKPQKEVDDLYRQASLLDNEADNMANEILKTVGDNPEILPTLESQTIEDLIGSFNINESMSAAQETDAYMALVEEAIRRGMHKDYEKYPMTDIAAEYTLQDIKAGNTTGMVDLRNIDLNVSKSTKKETAPRVIKEGVSPQEALELTDEEIELFRRPALEGGRGTTEAFRKALKGRNEELTDLANQLKDGKIPVRVYRQAADRIRPIRELNSVPEPATHRELVSALDAGKRKKPIVGLTTTLSEGDEITARLDINAYTDYDVWVPTLTHNKQTMYKPTVVMRNVEFIQPDSPAVKKALNVAAGQAKAPFAVMKGNYVDIDDYDAFSLAKDNFKSEEWIQVGYDPTKRGYFYDRATGEPVLNAEEVIQVGSLVLAKNARKGDADAFAFNKGGMAMDEQMNAVFKSSRGYAEGGTVEVDPVSGNEVPTGAMPEEVRDDIPAKLSEGEYVVPADVVRYYGVKFFEDLRSEAKSGWQNMEKNGRIGGEPAGMEMIEPEDDMSFDISELEVMDDGEVEMAEGGFLQALKDFFSGSGSSSSSSGPSHVQDSDRGYDSNPNYGSGSSSTPSIDERYEKAKAESKARIASGESPNPYGDASQNQGYQDMAQSMRDTFGVQKPEGPDLLEMLSGYVPDFSKFDFEIGGSPQERAERKKKKGVYGYAEGGWALAPGDPGYEEKGALGLGAQGLPLGTEPGDNPVVETIAFRNAQGQTIYILFINGVPQAPIPPGYERVGSTTASETTTPEGDTTPQVVQQASVSDDNDSGPNVPMPEPVDYENLTVDEMQDMLDDAQSKKMDLFALTAGALNPMMGLAVKAAMMHSARTLEKEMERRLKAGDLTTEDQARLENMLKQSKEGGLLKKLYGVIKEEFAPDKPEEVKDTVKKPEAYAPKPEAGAVTKAEEGYVATPLSDDTMAKIQQAAKDSAAAVEAQRAAREKRQAEIDAQLAALNDPARSTSDLREARQKEKDDNIAQIKTNVQAIKDAAKESGKSIAEIGQTISPTDQNAPAPAKASTGGKGDQGLGSGWGGMAKGGLASKRNSKKKK